MLNVLISFAAGVVLTVLIRLGGFPWIAGIIPGTIAFLAVMVVLGRRSFTKVQQVFAQVQTELQGMGQNPKERKARVDRAVKMLEDALPLGKWQFLVEGEIHAQVGIIKYMFQDYTGALPSLLKASGRNWLAQTMKAATHYRNKNFAEMTKAFEDAARQGSKEGMVWAVYAWCLLQNKEKDKAIAVLGRGVAANPNDEKLKAALTSLQNDKKLKMKAWEPLWWNFGFETPVVQQQMMMPRGGRMRMSRR
jgi:tetratricopeptide (TPR) repeat protein